MNGIAFDLDIDPAWSDGTDWESLAMRAAETTAAQVPELAGRPWLVSLVLGDDEDVRALNAQWRGKDKPTNVLSFPMLERREVLENPASGAPEMLGDLILAHGVCAREATEKGIAVADHASHLMVHGLLHLAGYDHEAGEAEAEEMEDLERKVLAQMGLADPYA